MSQVNDVNECRYVKLTSACFPNNLNIIHPTKKFDTAFIPPSKTSFLEHLKRENFENGKRKRSHIQFPHIPSPFDDNGWGKDDNNILHLVWYKGDELPDAENEDALDGDEDEDEDEESTVVDDRVH